MIRVNLYFHETWTGIAWVKWGMPSDALEVFNEARSFTGSLADLHPLKLDRWHRGLVGLPDAIYMQYGCPDLYEQVGVALEAVKALIEVLGVSELPLDPREIARRRIGAFGWYVTMPEGGPVRCVLKWDQEAASWEVYTQFAPNKKKLVASFQEGFEIGKTWTLETAGEVGKKE